MSNARSPFRTTLIGAAIVVASLSSGCAGLSRVERERVRTLESQGIDSTAEGNNNAWVAGILQIVPGVGNFYLASGTEEHNQIWFGVLNIIPGWLVWPFGILWAVPQGAVDAHNINQRQTVTYYFDTEEGRAALARLRAQRSPTPAGAPAQH